jgi:3D (Asp-Asp-Asp) domain-containing protein
MRITQAAVVSFSGTAGGVAVQTGGCPEASGLRARGIRARIWGRRIVTGAGAVGMVALTAFTAILAKEATFVPALVDVRSERIDRAATVMPVAVDVPLPVEAPAPVVEVVAAVAVEEAKPEKVWPAETRWFDGRPVRPARTVWMTVTGYSPDERSCGDSADGITATLHSVETNGFSLVAADPKVLPYGSIITVPGYDEGNIVPVLDCGGAIKGNRLDLLYPTHEEAVKWGRQRIKVTIWEYADGGPRTNPRRVR